MKEVFQFDLRRQHRADICPPEGLPLQDDRVWCQLACFDLRSAREQHDPGRPLLLHLPNSRDDVFA